MATITLTDRISVRVTAKDSTESSAQKKRDGGNTAAALGGTGLTDSEKEELGDDLGETVTGEDGKTYARSDKVAGVLKKIAQEGKLSEPTEVHEGILDTDSGILRNLDYAYPLTAIDITSSDYPGKHIKVRGVDAGNYPDVYCAFYDGYNSTYAVGIILFSKTTPYQSIFMGPFDNNDDYLSGSGVSIGCKSDMGANINDTYYPYYATNNIQQMSNIGSMSATMGTILSEMVENSGFHTNTYVDRANAYFDIAGWLYGPVSQSGGAKVDPTGKTDSQIQKDLEDFAALNNCKMTSESGDTYIAVTDANGNPLYFLGT